MILKLVPILAVVCAGIILSACEEEAAPVVERIRAIKTFTVTDAAGGVLRRYSGTIIASDRTSLSFSASGTVAEVAVNQGDRVQVGQLLAALDPKTFNLDIDAARADLRSAKAKHDKEALNLERQSALHEKKITAKAAYDKAVAAEAAALEEVNVAQSKLALALRNLDKANLTAPFEGIIAMRDIEPFVEVSGGKTVFEINSEGALELVLSIPDAVISRMTVGQDLLIEVGVVNECGCAGEIIEIGASSGPANAVEVKAAFFGSPGDLLPGMSAEAVFVFAGPETARGYLVPLDALAPAESNTGYGFIYIFQSDSQTVRKVAVKAGEGRENLIEVVEGVELGDVIASAGVSFLRDGQKVTLATN